MMKKNKPSTYQVELSVGRSFCLRVKANSENHAAMIAKRMLERTGTRGFIAAPDTWFDIQDSVRLKKGRPAKWRSPRWSYPWERLGESRARLQAALNELDQEIRKLHRQRAKTRRA